MNYVLMFKQVTDSVLPPELNRLQHVYSEIHVKILTCDVSLSQGFPGKEGSSGPPGPPGPIVSISRSNWDKLCLDSFFFTQEIYLSLSWPLFLG